MKKVTEKAAKEVTGAVKKVVGKKEEESKSIEELLAGGSETPITQVKLANGKIEKSRKAVKAETKADRAKAKGEEIAQKDIGLCAICGKPIKQGHFVGRLIADDTHPARVYHEKTCGVGTENWKAFKDNGKTPPAKPPVTATEKIAAKSASPKKSGNGKGIAGNKYGHHGEIAVFMDGLFEKGTTQDDFVKVLGKKFPDAKMPWSVRFKKHIEDLGKHGAKVAEKNGIYRIA